MIRLGVKAKSKQVPPGGPAYMAAAGKRRAAAKAARRAMSTASIVSIKAPSMMRTGGFSFKATGGKELNFVDTTVFTQINTTPIIQLLNGMAQGTTASTRIGRRIQMKSIEMRGYISADTASTAQMCRFALVLDKQANAAAPAWTDIYDAATPQSLRNISNKARFWVLWDSGITALNGSTTAGQITDTTQQTMELYKRINIPVQYNAGSAGTVGDIQTNALYFVGVGNVAAGTGDGGITLSIRIRYDDS